MDHLVTITILNVLLLGVLLLLQPLVRDIAVGFKYTISNFDDRVDEGVFARRLAMVRSNQIEALVLWVPTVLLGLHLSLAHPHLGLIGVTFLGARVAYAVVSLAGIPLLRSLAWSLGFAAWAYLTWLLWSAS